MFTGISQEICQEAWEGVLPMIQALAATERFNKYAGTVIVVDPRTIDRPKASHAQEVFDTAVIFTEYIGDFEEPRYMEVALSKAFVTWKTGLPSSVVQQQFPYHYSVGDTFWGGSTIDAGGLIVAFSGVQQVHDEAISECMASLIRAIARDEMTKDGGVLDSWDRNGSFIVAAPATGG